LSGHVAIVTAAGFAATVVFAHKYRGQEISSKQCLREAGIDLEEDSPMRGSEHPAAEAGEFVGTMGPGDEIDCLGRVLPFSSFCTLSQYSNE
jgi:hypothetical protein